MTVDLATIVVICGLAIQSVTFVSIFTRLENRLTKLETTLDIITQSLKGATFINRREMEN